MIVFIPIKEESQRVPGKNFRKFGSDPLYRRCLLKLNKFDVHVDTDSAYLAEQIQSDALLSHVKVFTRPNHLLGHEVSVCDIMKNSLGCYAGMGKIACQVHVTSPFLDPKTLFDAEKYIQVGHDSVVSCSERQVRLWREEGYGYCPVNHNPIRLEQTQDLPIYLEENSLFYIFKLDNFLRTGLRVGSNPFFYRTGRIESMDIDTEEDWNECVQIDKWVRNV